MCGQIVLVQKKEVRTVIIFISFNNCILNMLYFCNKPISFLEDNFVQLYNW